MKEIVATYVLLKFSVGDEMKLKDDGGSFLWSLRAYFLEDCHSSVGLSNFMCSQG